MLLLAGCNLASATTSVELHFIFFSHQHIALNNQHDELHPRHDVSSGVVIDIQTGEASKQLR